MEQCDELGVAYNLQNKAFYTAEKRESFSSIKQELSDELKKVSRLNKTLQKSEKHEIER